MAILTKNPYKAKPVHRSWILNEVGMCYTGLGRLETAVSFYERRIKMSLEIEDWREGSIGYNNLAELNANLGRLAASADAAVQALKLARRAANKQNEEWSQLRFGWAAHLRGEIKVASDAFKLAESLEKERSGHQYLYSLQGIQHTEHLRRVGEADYARRVTAANLEICERNRWLDDTSRCRHVLGELDADEGQTTAARTHFDNALTIARGISKRDVLIEALLARGRWVARSHVGAGFKPAPTEPAPDTLPLQQALSDLREALGYATDGGYRIYEADIRIALAWTHLADNNPTAARQEASRARTMSAEMGYHWGLVDADEVLAEISGQ